MFKKSVFRSYTLAFTGILFATSAVSLYAAEEEDNEPQYEHEKIVIPPASAEESIREKFSLKHAIDYVDNGAIAWTKSHSCISCHTNGSYMVMRPALEKFLGKPSSEFREFYSEQLVEYQKMEEKELNIGANAATVVYMAAGLAEWDSHVDKKLSAETDEALRFMFRIQKEHGAWNSVTCWAPFESSEYQLATIAAMAVTTAPGWLDSVKDDETIQAGIAKLTKFLRETPPPHEYGEVLLLWTSTRYPGLIDKQKQKEIVELIFNLQGEDGGWSMRSFAKPEEWGKGNRAERLNDETDAIRTASDGHQTGLALLVLKEAGVAADDPRIQKGLNWLLTNQRESGRWWTRSLNTDEWHFITYSGTLYPITALINYEALPKPAPAEKVSLNKP